MINKITVTKPNGEVKTHNPPAHQIDCRTVDCHRKSYWAEKDANGELLFCFRARHDGQNHAVKLSLAKIKAEMEGAAVHTKEKLPSTDNKAAVHK